MDKKSQENYKVQMYELVRMFVRAYQRRYYIQYKGDIDDLASDFYLEFMTPKARELGKEQSLLDKFDPNVTTLPYLVKVSVIRMLIDRSRSDKAEVNYENLYDEYGDVILANFNLVDEPDTQIEDFDPDEEEIALYRKAWKLRTEEQKETILENFRQVENILAPNIRNFLLTIIGSPKKKSYYLQLEDGSSYQVYQVTEKSIQLLHKDVFEIRTYNKATGEARGKHKGVIVREKLDEFLAMIGEKTFKLKSYELE